MQEFAFSRKTRRLRVSTLSASTIMSHEIGVMKKTVLILLQAAMSTGAENIWLVACGKTNLK